MAHTYDGKRGVGLYNSSIITSSTAVDPGIFQLHIDNEEDIIIRHHVHATFTSGREVEAAVLLPCYLRCRWAGCSTLEPCRAANTHRQIQWHLCELWIYCSHQHTDRGTLHHESDKHGTKLSVRIFARYWPIFKILSLADSGRKSANTIIIQVHTTPSVAALPCDILILKMHQAKHSMVYFISLARCYRPYHKVRTEYGENHRKSCNSKVGISKPRKPCNKTTLEATSCNHAVMVDHVNCSYF